MTFPLYADITKTDLGRNLSYTIQAQGIVGCKQTEIDKIDQEIVN